MRPSIGKTQSMFSESLSAALSRRSYLSKILHPSVEKVINYCLNAYYGVFESTDFIYFLIDPVMVKSDVTKLHSVTSNSTAVPCMAFVKVYNTSMQSQKPIESQIQALTLSLGGDSSGDDGVRSVFTQLQQLTRHLYAPVVRAAGQNIEVCFSI